MCRVNFCCCGCSLRTGCLIIAGLGIALSLIQLIAYSAGIALIAPGAAAGGVGPIAGIAIFISDIVVAVLMLILYIFLVVGVRKERPGYLAFWCIMEIVLTSIQIIQFILSLTRASGAQMQLFLIINGISIGLAIYYIIVVNSYRLVLKEQQEEKKGSSNGTI